MMENVTLTQQEQARLQVLNNLLAGYMTTEQAATLMGVSTRHTRRILAAYRERAAAALAHGNGQVPGCGVRVRHPDCTAQAAADCVSGASCSASCFVVTPGVR